MLAPLDGAVSPNTLVVSQSQTLVTLTQDSDTASEKLLSDDPGHSNVSRRPKRKHGDVANVELKQLLCEIQRKQEAEFLTIKKDMNTIKQQNKETQNTLEFLSDMHDTLLKKLESLEKENSEQKHRIQSLEAKVEQLERTLKSTSLEIRNISITRPETKANLKSHVLRLGEIVNQPIQHNDIRDIFRIKTKSEPGPIVVEFSSSSNKEELIKSVINFNKEKIKEQKINTSHFNVPGRAAPVYITEILTAKTRRLYFLTREFMRSNHFTSCWTAYGKVYARKKEGSPPIRIDSEDSVFLLYT